MTAAAHPDVTSRLQISTTTPADETRAAGVVRGWRLTALAALLVCLMTAALLVFYGAGEEGLRSVIRNTARTSFALFTAGFVGPALALAVIERALRLLDSPQP